MKINEFVPDSSIFNNMKTQTKTTDNSSDDFLSIFKNKLDEVNAKQVDAENATTDFIKGDGPDVQDLMLTTSDAKMSLELAVQIRNKLVDAYQELNRIQL